MTINEWLEISEMSGKGNAKVTLTAPSYEEGETRTLQLAVRGRYGTKYVNIRQDSKAETIVNQYLWVLLEEEGEISGIKSSTIQYSYDRESWTSFPSNVSITVPANTYVWLRNTSEDLNYSFEETVMNVIRFSVKGSVGGDLSSMGNMKRGNFESLFYINENLTDASKLILPWDVLEVGCYKYMFRGCHSLVNAPVLPATTLAENCYDSMFEYCTSLETAPQLPSTELKARCYLQMFENCTSLVNAPELLATELAESCYEMMFYGCTSLTAAPELLATTLSFRCCANMFNGCTSLTTAPTLPAPTLVNSCYWYMFYNCSNLNYIKMLATDINAIACLNNWVEGVAPTGTFVKHPNMNDLTIGVDGIPEGWVVMNEGNGEGDEDDDDEEDVNNDYFWVKLEEEGEISGIKSSTIQYSYDRESWTSFPSNSSITAPANTYVWLRNTDEKLIYDKISFSTRGSVGGDLSSMGSMQKENFRSLFSRNENLTDASKLILPWDVLEENCYEFMFYNCTSLTTAPVVLPATTLNAHCYYSMFKGCTSLTTAPELPATTLAETCYLNMFVDCTSLTTAPELPATTLKDDCYGYMFVGCTNLNYIKILATDLGINNFTYGWVRGVAPTGTFVKKQGVSFMDGDSGIPDGWTVIEINE